MHCALNKGNLVENKKLNFNIWLAWDSLRSFASFPFCGGAKFSDFVDFPWWKSARPTARCYKQNNVRINDYLRNK